jgi:hypothetical protein
MLAVRYLVRVIPQNPNLSHQRVVLPVSDQIGAKQKGR